MMLKMGSDKTVNVTMYGTFLSDYISNSRNMNIEIS